jgi:putative Mg2+ transporter-C (MgtC) family protein
MATADTLIHELFPDFGDTGKLIVVFVRLAVAMVLGGLIGFERERDRKAAGMRTYMLVALGAALFTLGPISGGMPLGELGRVIQGIATGIGFVGAGTILKLSEQQEVRGLTTAAGIWATAAMGVAAGAGWLWPAVIGCFLMWVVLFVLRKLEAWLQVKPPTSQHPIHQGHE